MSENCQIILQTKMNYFCLLFFFNIHVTWFMKHKTRQREWRQRGGDCCRINAKGYGWRTTNRIENAWHGRKQIQIKDSSSSVSIPLIFFSHFSRHPHLSPPVQLYLCPFCRLMCENRMQTQRFVLIRFHLGSARMFAFRARRFSCWNSPHRAIKWAGWLAHLWFGQPFGPTELRR